jgi:pSer/pThr/pTyr-binding forkhead associated (FHA) protein
MANGCDKVSNLANANLTLARFYMPPESYLPRHPFLIVDGNRQITLANPLVRIGRSREMDVVIDDRRVSRLHLELRWQSDLLRYLCVDMDSTGGTKINGYPIAQCTLEAGDVVSLGGAEIIYGEEFALPINLPDSLKGTTEGNVASDA